MNCAKSMPNGINDACRVPLSQVKNIFFADLDVSFDDPADFIKLQTWGTKIAAGEMFIPNGIVNAERTTDDPDVQTSGRGGKVVARVNPPSMMVGFDLNMCDFKEWLRHFEGGMYQIIFELEDGSIMAHKRATGAAINGFKARVHAVAMGVTDPAAVQDYFRVYLNFVDYDEFKDFYIKEVAWNANLDLIGYMLEGLNMTITTAYSTDTVVVDLFARCGDALAGLDVTDFVVLENDIGDGAKVNSFVDNTLGSYDLLITDSGGTTPMAATEYAIIQATPSGKASNLLFILGA